jgi:long-chain acyl-CoA synthetase
MQPGVGSAVLVQDFLRHSAERLPHKVALIAGERRLNYGELAAAVSRLAVALPKLGLRRGGRVVIDLVDGPELIISIFGVLQAGGTLVVVDHAVKQPKLTYILDDCQASALIISSEQLAWAEQLVADVPSLKTVILSPRHPGTTDQLPCLSFEAILDQFGCERTPACSIDRDLARLAYTCMANGNAQGVMFDHSSMVFAAQALVHCLGTVEDDRFLIAAPLSECGLYYLFVAFSLGATVVLAPDCLTQAALPVLLAHESVSVLAGSPAGLAELPGVDPGEHDLSSLRTIVSTADAHDPGLVDALRNALPGVPLILLQSVAEAQIALHLQASDFARELGCAGLALPGTEAWLEDGYGKIIGSGQIGKLVIRGRHLMRGYWGEVHTTGSRGRQGRYPGEIVCYTDDLYRRDSEGYFYFIAHQDDVVSSWGHRVVPSEVEDVLYRLPGVSEAAVIGVPEARGGQALKAFVVSNKGIVTVSDVLNHCRAYLEPYMVPRYVEICTELPKTIAGKVLKSALIARNFVEQPDCVPSAA